MNAVFYLRGVPLQGGKNSSSFAGASLTSPLGSQVCTVYVRVHMRATAKVNKPAYIQPLMCPFLVWGVNSHHI